jgi:spore coat protein U-like protein
MRITRIALAVTALCGSILWASGLCRAGSSPAVNVTARVLSDCLVSTDYEVLFSDYDPFNVYQKYAQHDQTATASHVQLRCTSATHATIYIDHGLYAGKAAGTKYGLRAMKQGATPGNSPASYLTYHLCQDAGCTKEWGMPADTSSGLAYGYAYNSATDAQTNLSIYGRIDGGQIVGTGYYADTVTVWVQF